MNAYAERSADETVISPTLSATHHSGDLNVLEVDRFDKNVAYQMPMLGPGVHPCCFMFVLQLE